jgi:amidase
VEDLSMLDATAQAELVRRKEVKPMELVEAAIERIERLNPALNAVVTPIFDLARKAASGPLPDGPFAGVPLLLKDLGPPMAGVRYTMGSRFLDEYMPDHDGELVARYKRAGLVILGRTNTPELGLLPTTEPVLFGPTRNPWDTNRTPGGSSGGSAAAVASGMVPAAHGGDGGGSIRIPASACGLFGLKPTRGRTPLGPDYGDQQSGLTCEHAITRSVRDSAALLDATAGPDVGDPYWAPLPTRPFLEEVGADPARLRIGVLSQGMGTAALHADCVAAVEDASRLCETLGHHVEAPAMPEVPSDLLAEMFTIIWSAGCAQDIDTVALLTGRAPTPDAFEPLTWALAEKGRGYGAPAYLTAVMVMQRFAREFAKLTVHFDVLLTPTLAEPPVPLGTFDAPVDDPLSAFDRAGEFVPFTPICNVTGQPAMSVPLFWNDEGLPIGVHFIGRYGDEATLFRLAAQLEQARPWAQRRPPVFA